MQYIQLYVYKSTWSGFGQPAPHSPSHFRLVTATRSTAFHTLSPYPRLHQWFSEAWFGDETFAGHTVYEVALSSQPRGAVCLSQSNFLTSVP